MLCGLYENIKCTEVVIVLIYVLVTEFVQIGFLENATEMAVFFQPGHTTMLSFLASLEGSSDQEITFLQ